jgi:hypothetical protein
MKAPWKLCRLAVLALTALAVMGGIARASTFTSPAGTAFTGTVQGTPLEEIFVIDTAEAFSTECKPAPLEFVAKIHGAALTAQGEVKSVFTEACSSGKDFTTLRTGTLEFHAIGNGNATVTSSGFEFTTTGAAPFGAHCKYKTSSTHYGTFTGSKTTGGSAILHIAKTSIPRVETSSPVCGNFVITNGSYLIKTPAYLDIS